MAAHVDAVGTGARVEEKRRATACAVAALAGIQATPSHDDRGRRTVILTAGPWTREILPEQLGEALAEARARCPRPMSITEKNMTLDGDDELTSGAGVEVAERQRLVDLQERAAHRGYVLRAVHSGFILAREGRLLHRLHFDDIVRILNTTDRQQ